jgi:fermentation-respiration switch protein FrsA (DUF1100 family)
MIIGCDSCFYYPDRTLYYTPEQLGLADCEEVAFQTSDGKRLWGWFVPARGASKGTVIHFHGNAENLTTHAMAIRWLPDAGYNVLAFDYRGYGKSEGSPTRAGTIVDGLAAVDYVKTRPEYDPDRLFVYGQSLGGAVATVVAAKRPEVRAVVAEATFGDYRGIATEHLRRRVLFKPAAQLLSAVALSDGFNPIDVVDQIAPRPLLVITGEKDTICYPQLGRELYDVAKEPKAYVEVPGAYHLEAVEAGGRELRERVIATFEAGAAAADEAQTDDDSP